MPKGIDSFITIGIIEPSQQTTLLNKGMKMATQSKSFDTKLNGGLVYVSYDMTDDGDVEEMVVEFNGIEINLIVSDSDFADLEMECYAHYDKCIADDRYDAGQARYESMVAA